MAIAIGSLVAVGSLAGTRALPYAPQKGRVTQFDSVKALFDVAWMNGNQAALMPDLAQAEELLAPSASAAAMVNRYVRPLSLPNFNQNLSGPVVDAYQRSGVDVIVVRTPLGFFEGPAADFEIVEGR